MVERAETAGPCCGKIGTVTGESSYTGSAGASMPGRVDECYAAPWIDPLAKQQLAVTVSRVMSRSWGDGRYVATSLLGRGGTAEVWRATDRVLHRDVAVKAFLAGDPSVGEDDEARFRSEVNLLAQLNHPHIVALWDAGVTDRQPWCSMAYIDGGTLAHWSGQRTPVDVADLGIQLADALVYLHACGVVHRDLKPANILIDHQGRAYLSDFGIARLSSATRITSTGVLIGTAAYLAPEQVRGEAVGVPADIYSLGLVP